MHILVIRLSAMGDVALTLPALRGALNSNPNLRITILTRGFFAPFFANIDRLEVFAPDLKDKHKGIRGLSNLFKELKKSNFDLVFDLHSVIRSKYLSGRFKLSGTKVYSIKKDRREKKAYLKSKAEPNLKHSIERYTAVFKEAGLKLSAATGALFEINKGGNDNIEKFIVEKKLQNKKLIGIAPFAKHNLKMWPTQKVKELIAKLEEHCDIKILLFGGGKEELEKLSDLALKHKNCLISNIGFSNELALIKRLSVMVSMDSSNMHLAALSGIPVISIWGATHPGIGFSAWDQPKENSIQIPKSKLQCRPCTIYGKGECKRGDFACMEWIENSEVYNAILKVLSHNKQS